MKSNNLFDIATKREAIFQDLLLWFDRYNIAKTRPEHMIATCFVYKTIDDIDIESFECRVALKLVVKKFIKELVATDVKF